MILIYYNFFQFNAISIKHEDRRDALQNPNKEEGFIVHQGDHWYALRRIGDIWYDLNSLRPSASIVDDLPSLITSLTMSGFTVFVVRGPFSRSERPKMLNKTNQYYLTHQDMQRMNQEATAKKAGSSSSLAQRNSSNSAGEYQWPVSRGNTCSPILGSSTAPPNGVSASTNSNGNATPQVLTQEEIELQEAIRLSMESFAQENAPEEPKPEPVGTEGVYVIQIRSHLCTIRRKFQVDSATVKDLFGWIEWHCFKNNIKQNNVHLNVLDVKLTMNFGPELTRRASGRYLNGDLDVSPLDTLRSVGISDNSSFMMSF